MISIPEENSPDTDLGRTRSISSSPNLKIFAPVPTRPDTYPPPTDSYVPPPPPSPPPSSSTSNDPLSKFPRDSYASLPINDLSIDVSLDDENLSSVERIYLLCISKETMHRVFIARSLHTFLLDVAPVEAVEYVLPLLNTLAVDEEDAVKEALAINLASIMWWFFENCKIVEDELPNNRLTDQDLVQEGPPLLSVQSFTPILGSLLVDFNPLIGVPTRFTVVDILNRIHVSNSKGEDVPPFGQKERKILEDEIIHQVIIGMGRLELSEEYSPSPILRPEVPPSSLQSPPGIIDSTVFHSPLSPAFPSSLDFLPGQTIPEIFTGPLSPPLLNLPPPVPTDSFPARTTSSDAPIPVVSITSPPSENVFEPWPEISASQSNNVTVDDSAACTEKDMETENQSNYQELDRAAIGRLSSMSLIATVTAHAELPEETIRAFADEVVYIGEDALYIVRREAAFAVGALAKVVPAEVLQLSLLPLFKSLSRDPIWNVRHSSVFALPNILAKLPQRQRRELALQTLLLLSNDESPVVKTGVFEVLGEVIYAFHEDEEGVPTELVNLFVGREKKNPGQEQYGARTDGLLSNPSKVKKPPDTNNPTERQASPTLLPTSPPPEDYDDSDRKRQGFETDSTREQLSRDAARSIITSFNFPAVTLALGPGRWHEISDYYQTLSKHENPRVRRTIAASLGEMARILGSRIAESHLLDIWQDMVHDVEDGTARLKALSGLPQFVAALEGSARQVVMGSLVGLWERWLTGWREKEGLTVILPELAALAGNEGEVVRVLLRKALTNNVAAVREAGVKSLACILEVFELWPHLEEGVREDIESLARSEVCRRRVTYVACLCALVDKNGGENELLRDGFWETIDRLSQDEMTDVRIGVARLMGIICEKFYAQVSRVPLSLFVVERLSRDPSRDVREFVAFMQVSISKLELLIVPHDNDVNNHNHREEHSYSLSAGGGTGFATFSRPPCRSA